MSLNVNLKNLIATNHSKKLRNFYQMPLLPNKKTKGQMII